MRKMGERVYFNTFTIFLFPTKSKKFKLYKVRTKRKTIELFPFLTLNFSSNENQACSKNDVKSLKVNSTKTIPGVFKLLKNVKPRYQAFKTSVIQIAVIIYFQIYQ